MIKTEIVDLYQRYGTDSQGAAGGRLLAWIWQTAREVTPSQRRRPAALIIPGGGYQHVSPREAEPVALRFLAQGYAAFVLEYSVSPSRFPTALREVAMAIRYIREHADELEVNPQMVAVVGFSAGGHLGGCLGTMYDAPELREIGPPALLRPDALGLCYPVVVSWGRTHEGTFLHLTENEPELRERMSLEKQVRPDMPPVYLWHTRDDASVPVRNSLLLAQALDEAGVSFVLHVCRQGPHGLGLANAESYPVGKIPEISGDIRDWPETMMEFFGEIGFAITDGGEVL